MEKDVIVIGAGVAGLTAGIYLKRSSLDALILDKYAPGGKLNNIHRIDNYPGEASIAGPDLAMKMLEQATALGVELGYGNVSSIRKDGDGFLLTSDAGDFKAKAIIVATGLDQRSSKLPGEDRLLGKGVSYCATCDGAFFKGKKVALYGYDDRAIEEAIYLAGVVDHVFFLHPEPLEGAPAHIETLLGLKNVTLLEKAKLEEVLGENHVESILYSQGNEKKSLEVAGLFPLTGEVPSSALLSPLGVNSEKGFVLVDSNCATNVPGIYAAGDIIAKKLRQIVTAASDGAIAATSALAYLRARK